MRRLHLLEIEDQSWCPTAVRDAMTDYLQFVVRKARPYAAAAPHLKRVLERSGVSEVVDLCSGGGGPWPSLLPDLDGIRVRLTDRYPNFAAFESLRSACDGRIVFEPDPVDASDVPRRLAGFRTLFSSFHHFRPAQARGILEDAVRKGQGIAVFEATQRRTAPLLGMLLVPLFVLLVTPAVRPFRASRLFWTYLVPAVPLFALFDGIVSCLRTYTPAELRAMTAGLDSYDWEIGEEKVARSAAAVTYLVGVPARRLDS
jgi:hypothetical protein